MHTKRAKTSRTGVEYIFTLGLAAPLRPLPTHPHTFFAPLLDNFYETKSDLATLPLPPAFRFFISHLLALMSYKAAVGAAAGAPSTPQRPAVQL